MTQFQDSPAGTIARNRSPQAQRMGIAASRVAPGLAIPDNPRFIAPYSRGADTAARLMQSLGMLGDLMQGVARYRAITEAENQKVELLDRGHGKRAAVQQWPVIADAIEQHKLVVPDAIDGKPVAPNVYAETVVAGLVPEGMSDAFVDEFTNHLIPRVTEQFINRMNRDRAEQEPRILRDLVDGLIGTTDQSEFVSRQKFLVDNLQWQPDRARDSIGLSVMDAALATFEHDPASATSTFEAAKKFIGEGVAVEEVGLRETRLLKKQSDLNSRKEAIVISGFEDMILDFRRGGRTLDSIQTELDKVTTDVLPSDKILQIQGQVDSLRKAMQSEQIKIAVDQKREQLSADYREKARSLFWTESVGGGLYQLDDESHELLDKTSFSLNAKKIGEQVAEEEFARIQQQYANNPSLAFANIVHAAARNRIAPRAWSAALNGAPLQAAMDTLIRSNDGKPATMPPQVNEAIELHQRLNAINPGVAEFIVHDAQAKLFYRMVDAAAQLPEYEPVRKEDGSHDFGKASVAALRAIASGRSDIRTDNMPAKVVQGAVEEIGGNNPAYVSQQVERLATLYRSIQGMSWERAIDRAAHAFRSTHHLANSNYVPANELDPKAFDLASRVIAERYVDTVNPKLDKLAARKQVAAALTNPDVVIKGPSENVRTDHLALIPDGSGYWRLVNARMDNIDVEQSNIPGLSHFTTKDLKKIIADLQKKSQAEDAARLEEIRKEMARQRAMPKAPPAFPTITGFSAE